MAKLSLVLDKEQLALRVRHFAHVGKAFRHFAYVGRAAHRKCLTPASVSQLAMKSATSNPLITVSNEHD
jgi:hypothetical protein